VCCPIGIIPTPVDGVLFTDKTTIIWNPQPWPCTYHWNLYMIEAPTLVDADSNGVADDYGKCLWSGLPSPTAPTAGSDPPSGWVQFYNPTAENTDGEGSMGNASNGSPREPNYISCPTPP
jgi:hypothetical protein